MKFTPLDWSEEKVGQDYATSGRVRGIATVPGNLFVTQYGFEALALAGVNEFDVEIAGDFEWRFESSARARVFVHSPIRRALPSQKESYANLDRQVQESGAVLEIKKAVRKAQLEMQQQRREMMADIDMMRRAERGPVAPIAPVEPGEQGEPVEPVESEAQQGGAE